MMFEQTLSVDGSPVGLDFPKSMSAAVDLWFAVADAQKVEDNTKVFSKLAAASVGIGIDRSNEAVAGLPEYDISSGDFIAYGNQVIDWMGAHGVKYMKLLNLGSAYLAWASSELMAEEEIVQMEDFTEATEDRLTG